jgi:hypothetical protein
MFKLGSHLLSTPQFCILKVGSGRSTEMLVPVWYTAGHYVTTPLVSICVHRREISRVNLPVVLFLFTWNLGHTTVKKMATSTFKAEV